MPPRTRKIDPSEVTEAVLLPPRIASSSSDTEWDPDLEAAFEQLKEDFRTNANEGTLWVYRVPLDERAEIISAGKQVFLFSSPVDRYSTEELLQKVQSEHMQGLKVTAVRITATKKGERGVRFNQLVLVEAPHRAALPDPLSPAPRDSSTAELVRAIQESQHATVTMFRELLKAQPALPAPAPVNPMAQLREMAEVMFLLNKGHGAPAAGSSLLEQLQVFKEFRGLAADLGVGENGGGAEDGPAAILKHLSPWAQLFASRLPGAAPVLAHPPRVALPPPTPPASSTAAAPAVAAPTAPTDPSSIPTPAPASAGAPSAGVSPVLSQLREQFLVLTQSAASGTDPGSLVPLILNAIPPGSVMESQLIDFLESPSWWQQLTALCPPAAPHSDWFTRLRTQVLAEFEDESPG